MTELNRNDNDDFNGDNGFAQQDLNDNEIVNQEELNEDNFLTVERPEIILRPEVIFAIQEELKEIDENELSLSDDAEKDLLTILESKILSEEEAENLSEDAEDDVLDGVNDSVIVPRQKDEQHCQRCWLLVRSSAPRCPIHDDDCPIFKDVG